MTLVDVSSRLLKKTEKEEKKKKRSKGLGEKIEERSNFYGVRLSFTSLVLVLDYSFTLTNNILGVSRG